MQVKKGRTRERKGGGEGEGRGGRGGERGVGERGGREGWREGWERGEGAVGVSQELLLFFYYLFLYL